MQGKKYLTMTMVAFCLMVVGLLDAMAGVYYVSPSGSATWTQATSINTPTSASTAFANASAGDTVYFRGGTYNLPAKNFGDTYHGYYEPAKSGTATNPITFAAYPGETPLFNGTAGGSGDVPEFATIFGTNGKDYIVFDGFKLQADNGAKAARFMVFSTDSLDPSTYITLKNLNINGGSTVWASTDNREGIRVDNSRYITIQDSKIYNFRQSANWHNTSAFKSYNSHYVTIENCEIYNVSNGIYNKRDGIGHVYQFNYIHNAYTGIYIWAYVGTQNWNQTDITINNNVINYARGGDGAGNGIYFEVDTTTVNADRARIYNNTIFTNVANASGVPLYISKNGAGQVIHSNVIQTSISSGSYGLWALNATATAQEIDYNNYGNLASFKVRWNGTYYTSLGAWKATTALIGSLSPDAHSIAADPLFTNGSGTYANLSDFNLRSNSPSKGTGKGGFDMGAAISRVGVGARSLKPTPPTAW